MNIQPKNLIALVTTALLMFASCQSNDTPVYKDASQSVEHRIDDLMGRMSLEEKVAQMCQYVGPEHIRDSQKRFEGKKVNKNDDAYGFYPNLSVNDLKELVRQGKVGSFLHVVTLEEANELQALAMESPLQIPLIIGIDAIHGNAMCTGTTVYPTPIGQASSFNLDLVKQLSHESALEVRATGAHWTFTPNIDLARDPRWGRIGETFGEDTYLVSRMGVATIKGYQGENMEGSEAVVACAKHLIAGGEPANGTNASPMDVSLRTLREVHLPPYKAAIEEAGVFSLMAAHNELNGIPCHANKWMMTDVMRGEYDFDGFIVSDWLDVGRINHLHHVAPTAKDASWESVTAGLDMNMHGPDFMTHVVELAQEGRIPMERIDEACAKILEAKFRLGLFENPYVDQAASEQVIYNKEHQATALKAAEQSIVLLKNDGLLPLDFTKFDKVFITGPNANNHTILGDWVLPQPENKVITVLKGLQERLPAEKIAYYNYGDDVRSTDRKKITEATAMARRSDLAIVVVGENPLRYQRTKTTGENTDRMTLDLLGQQEQLIKSIHATGIPTIVILTGGRPLSVNWTAANVPALIQAWEPGSFGGRALMNIIAGDVNPSAKLPVSMPRHSGQIQMIYNHKPSQYFHKYKDGASTPLYPFGHGLSYTKFEISEPQVSKTTISADESVDVTYTIQNVGERTGTEIVQLYIRDLYSSATRPIKELKDFARVELKPGEKKTLTFTLTPEKLAFFDREMKWTVEPGTFEVMVGNSSVDKQLKKTSFEVK